MNEETRRAIRRLTWGVLALAGLFVLVQGIFFGYWALSGPLPGSAASRATEALQGWFGIQAIVLAGFVLTAVGLLFALSSFFIAREASTRADETRDIGKQLDKKLHEANQLVGELEREQRVVRQDRAFLAARRRAAHDLYLEWSSRIKEREAEPREKEELTRALLEISHLFEGCAAPEEGTQADAITGLGSYLEGHYASVVRVFLRELDQIRYYAPGTRPAEALRNALRRRAAPSSQTNDAGPLV